MAELDEKPLENLELIKGFSLNFDTPDNCKTMSDLIIYAKNHGYKPGWAWYQAKLQGIAT
jgi:hypothetical protein